MSDAEQRLAEIREPMNVGMPMPPAWSGGRAGHIYVRNDPQERLGPGTKVVLVQGDGEGPYSDTHQLGIFWEEVFAEAFADLLRTSDASGVDVADALGPALESLDQIAHECSVGRADSFSGVGETLDAALDDLRDRIQALDHPAPDEEGKSDE